jgi:integrase
MMENGLAAGTIHYHHAVIHKALKTAMKWGLVNRNVADGVDVPRIEQKEMQVWDEDEVNRFIEAAKPSRYYALFHAVLFTGMRRSEALALRWQDVDFIFSQLYINRSLHHLKDGSYVFSQPKSARSRRTIALSPDAIQVLREHREHQEKLREALGKPLTDKDLVFCNEEGKPWRPNTITRAWNTQAKKAGVPVIRLHDARHTHASLMLKAGIHPKIVQERLGHSSIQMTLDIYSHVAPGIQQAAAASFDKLINPSREIEAIENY